LAAAELCEGLDAAVHGDFRPWSDLHDFDPVINREPGPGT